jgi:hypothetical protein
MPQRFVPSAAVAAVLVAIGIAALSAAIYLRYMVIENVPVGLACDAGEQSFLCLARTVAVTFDNRGVFGWVALIGAIVNFARPGPVLFAIALVAAGFGLVLHNAGTAGLAAGLLVLSFARPVVRSI